MVGFHKGPMGFQIDLDNGWTVSVHFGIGSYCSNRSSLGNPFTDIPDYLECPYAEIAAWPTDSRGEGYSHLSNWYKFEDGEEVKGWQSPKRVLEFVNLIADLPDTQVPDIQVENEWLSTCCDALPISTLDDGELYRLGTCSRCKNETPFTEENKYVRHG